MAKLKSEVAPKGMEFKPTEFVIGGKYATIMTVIAFPRMIQPGFLSDMTNINGVKLAIKHIPIEFEVLRKMLNKEIADLKVRYQSERDQTMQEKIRQGLQEAFRKKEMTAGAVLCYMLAGRAHEPVHVVAYLGQFFLVPVICDLDGPAGVFKNEVVFLEDEPACGHCVPCRLY